MSFAAAADAEVAATHVDTAEASRRVVNSTNELRREQKLPPTWNAPQLQSAAHYFADFMARTGKYGHAADGSEPAVRAKRFGYDYCIVAENIAQLYSSAGIGTDELARRLFDGWQSSPGHRRNMLNAGVTETAVAVAHNAQNDRYYAVQLFGRPASQSIDFTVANRAGVIVEYALDGQTFELPPRAISTHRSCGRAELQFRGKTLRPKTGEKLSIVNEPSGLSIQAQ